MHIENVKQLTETVHAYYDRYGIGEKAIVEIKELNAMPIQIEIHTKKPLTYEHLVRLSNVLWLLMPVGIMHELVNVVYEDNVKMQKLESDGLSFEISITPLPDTDNSKAKEYKK